MFMDWIFFEIFINMVMIVGVIFWVLGLYLIWGSGCNWLIE